MAKNSDEKVFKLPDSGIKVYWWLNLLWVFCLASWVFFAWADWQAYGYPAMPKVVFGFWLLVFLVLPAYCLFRIWRYRWNQIVISKNGISQAQSETRNVFIGWKEIASIKPNSFWAHLRVADISGKKKIDISYKYENVEVLLTNVFGEYIEKFEVPEMPVKYGVPLIPYEFSASLILTILIFGIGWLLFAAAKYHEDTRPFTYLLYPIFALIGPMFGTRAVVLDKKGITLFGFIGRKAIPWDELGSFSWNMEISRYTSRRNFVVTLRTKKNQYFNLAGWAGHQVSIFLAIKKIWNERHRK